ncbi:GNAT family N-acetyltransferase [Clostridium sp. 19966]|uniref:GNAT family N-acetyltransferase n=1 Tax=Clostridium sp. 19966 TaxID=2768166 RepID=UPI0028E071BF|nr:GNAT family N-acetyltransferase [Clostridium sp. 19966]MDT8717704.1 GNAT family N-acetyltransferase [Clostridium sp. 19966]
MIYYSNENLLIRSMVKSDIEKLVNGFQLQNWNKPYDLFMEYYHQQENNERSVVIAEMDDNVTGYVTILPHAQSGPFVHKNIPEIADFNVLIKYQRRGIGNRIMDAAEAVAREKSEFVSLGVGLHHGYGSAQKIYVKRGYIPDGTGVWYNDKQLEQYGEFRNDDDLVLYFIKHLK